MPKSKYKKARLTLPGKLTVLGWTYSRYLSVKHPFWTYYDTLKNKVLREALEQPDDMGKSLFMVFDEHGITYKILVKRK